MTYYPMTLNNDDRRSIGLVPQLAHNMMIVRTPKGSARGKGYALTPTPGLVLRATPATNKTLRGVFRKDGVCGGALFVVAGDTLYEVSNTWACTARGTVAGNDFVQWSSIGAVLYVAGGGILYEWDGTAFAVNADAQAPTPCYTLNTLGNRLIGSARGSDVNRWSAVSDGLDWPALAFNSSEFRADAIEGAIVVGADYLSYGRESLQILNAVGGPDETAITAVSDFVLDIGLLRRDCLNLVERTPHWISNERVPMYLRGFSPAPLQNPELTLRLLAMTEAQLDRLSTFTHPLGEKWLWAVRMTDGGPSLVYDRDTQAWHSRGTRGETTWAQAFAVDAYGYTVVAGPDSDALWTLDARVYDDAGADVERRVTVLIPMDGPTPIDNITLDIATYDQPLTGDHVNPKMLARFYKNGGQVDSIDRGAIERTFLLGRRGRYGVHPTTRRLGTFDGVDGCLCEFVITAPVGFMFYGVYVNEEPKVPPQ